MGNDIGIVPLADQSGLPFQKMLVFRRILKADDRADRDAFFGFRRIGGAVQQIFHNAGHVCNGGTLSVLFGGNRDPPFFLGFQSNGEHLEAVTLQILDKTGVIRDLAFRNFQGFSIHGPDLAKNFVMTGGVRRNTGNGCHLGTGAAGMEIQLTVGEITFLIQALQFDPLDLDAIYQRQGHGCYKGTV